MGTRVFMGRVGRDVQEEDIYHFLRKYGRVNDVMIKANFAFIVGCRASCCLILQEFDDYRDASDAIRDLDGGELCGERVTLELARFAPRGRDAQRADEVRGRKRDTYLADLRTGRAVSRWVVRP